MLLDRCRWHANCKTTGIGTKKRLESKTMDRRQQHLWMKDLVQHLDRCCDQWAQAEGGAATYLAQSIDRQLEELRRVLRPEMAVGSQRRAA